MKKMLLIGAVLCLALVVAAPAMALDFKATGQIYAKGFHNSNYGLDDNDASDSYMKMRFRLRTDFLVSDNLSVVTRFDALDGKYWGKGDKNTGNDSDNIDFDRAYMVIRTDFGAFSVGRMGGGTWGTSFNDTEGERDRIKWVHGMGDATLYAIYEKNHEGDVGNVVSDEDNDVYYLGATYKMENINMGLLYGFVNYKGVPTEDKQYHLLIPYITGQFGPFGVQGELRYNGFGDVEYDDPALKDRDIDQLAFNLEGTYSMDMFKFELGYVYVSGQEDDEDDINGYAGGIGDDWEKVWILTGSTDDGTAASLGGMGNLSATGGICGEYGAGLFYGGVTANLMEDLSVKFLIAYGEADETPSGVDDEYGWEYDLFVDYQIYDNLSYSFIAAYLDAGDFWKEAGGIDKKDFEDNLHLYHALTLKF